MRALALLLVGVTVALAEATADIRLAPGDSRQGYESADYVSDSLSIPAREGIAADLLANVQLSHLGLPTLGSYEQEPPDAAIIEIGRTLFFDRRLSGNKTMSCAMCHIPEQGFTSNELKRPIGFEGRGLKRNAPTLLNVVFNRRLFWDARENTLAQQIWSPLLAANEMNNPSVGSVVEQLQDDIKYAKMFEQAFGEPANMLNIGQALAQYQQSLLSADSRFDRWYFAGNRTALNQHEQRGFEVFTGKGSCSSCHHINDQYALFTDHQLHNTGVGAEDSMRKIPDTIEVQLAPGVLVAVDQKLVSAVGAVKENDLGRYEVTLDPKDRWKYRTPGLRNVALTAPYMHNGEFLSLDEVIQFYNKGGVTNKLLSPLIRPLNLTIEEQTALRAFLGSLTGSNVEDLVSDAFAAPVGDVRQQRGS